LDEKTSIRNYWRRTSCSKCFTSNNKNKYNRCKLILNKESDIPTFNDGIRNLNLIQATYHSGINKKEVHVNNYTNG